MKEYRINPEISVRKATLADTENIVKWRNNPRVVNNFIYRTPLTEEIHNNWMKTKVASGEVVQFVIEVLAQQEAVPVGSVYFRDIDNVKHTAEYGIFIGEDSACGKGIGNAVAGWAVEYAQTHMKLRELILRVFEDNEAAVKSYKNAGFAEYDKITNYMDGRNLIMMKAELTEGNEE